MSIDQLRTFVVPHKAVPITGPHHAQHLGYTLVSVSNISKNSLNVINKMN